MAKEKAIVVAPVAKEEATAKKAYRVFGPRMETVAQVDSEEEARDIAVQFKGSYKIVV